MRIGGGQELDDLASDPKVRDALGELQQYLSDAIAPLMVADAVALLLKLPPQLTAAEIHVWTVSQYRRLGASVPLSDYLYHAMRKIHLLGEFTLVPGAELDAFLAGLKAHVLESCPPDDREVLRDNLEHLGEAQIAAASPVPILHRLAADHELLAAAGDVAAKDGGLRGRRFAQLVERLARLPAPASADAAVPAAGRGDFASQLLAVAARSAADGEEFREYREHLNEKGLSISMEELFRNLSRRLPDWVVPSAGEDRPAPVPATAQAMQRVVTLEQDPRESARRFQELVQAAIEQVNGGSLGRAVTMIDLAAAILAEKKVDAAFVQSYRDQAHASLDPQRLRRFSEDAASQPLLRRLMAFFPALAPDRLLDELQHEEARERRRLLLALLEAHGAPARALAVQRLQESITTFGDKDAYYQRNLLYLLRRIPRPADAAIEPELELAIRLSQPDHPGRLVKEALANLGQLKDERAERALVTRVGELESVLLKSGEARADRDELSSALDRAVFALARHGTPSALRAVVNHSLKRHPQLGDTTARLASLSGQDLSGDPELVHRLAQALVAETPHKVFGFVLRRSSPNLMHLIEALSATPSAEVRAVLAGLVERFPDEEFGVAAAKALAGGPVPVQSEEAKAASLAGDLEVFGLPTLLQNLSQSEATGTLAITDKSGAAIGVITLAGGKLGGCKSGHLRGEEALFQMIERPSEGAFSFVNRRDAGSSTDSHGEKPRDLVPIFFEAMRRYDEFQQACALVPDYACLKPTGSKPTRPADETDSALLHEVWRRASGGAAALECESGLQADSYRVRRLLAHWVEEGALEPR